MNVPNCSAPCLDTGGLPCPGAGTPRRPAHPRFCSLMQQDPDTWRPVIVRTARQDAGVEPRPELPPAVVQVRNLARSTVEHVAAGMPQASPETRAARLEACRACPNLVLPEQRCGILAGQGQGCGCYVEAKASWAEQACPLGKWPVTPP